MTSSIRRSLLITLLTATTAVWLVGAAGTYLDARHETEELFDAQLAQSGRVLLAISLHEIHEERLFGASDSSSRFGEAISPELWSRGHPYEKNLAFQVWIERDFLAVRSSNAPLLPFSRRASGFSDVDVEGQRWRIFSAQTDDGDIKVQVGERYAVREELADAIVMRTLTPLLLTLPLLALIIWFGVGRSMDPLAQIANDMRRRQPNEFQPIDDAHVPAEAKPLTNALNALLARLKNTFERERRFTADAAHELRTPLAALKTQAEVALQATNEADRHQALRQVVRGVNRATHLVEQLLTLARLDPNGGFTEVKRLDLFILAEDVVGDLVPHALQKDIEISLSGTRGKFVEGSTDALRILLRNLVDNAIRYTPQGGVVEVNVGAAEQGILLSVGDSGSGIPEEERAQVFKRFYRRLGTKASGSGLGLSIVNRVAVLHNVPIELDSSVHGGLLVRVIFAHTRR